MEVKLLSRYARPPQRSSASSATYDLYALEAGKVRGMTVQEDQGCLNDLLVRTGITIQFPAGTCGHLLSCPDQALQLGVHAMSQVVVGGQDEEIKVLLYSIGNADYAFNAGDRIAQLVVVPLQTPAVRIVEG